MSTLTVNDVGPIKHLKLECQPGVNIVKGRNGLGKSILLDATQNLLAGKGGAPVRDGQRSGELEAFGAVLKVGGRTSHLGELEVVGIEGRLKPADIVDPGIDDELAADRKRIAALVQVASKELDPKPFQKLVGGEALFEALCPGAIDQAGGDPLKLAGIVKRLLDAEALKHERSAKEQEKHVAALREAIGKIDVSAECNPTTLQEASQAAMKALAALEARAEAKAQTAAQAEEARGKLADAESGKPIADVRARMKAQETRVKDTTGAVKASRERLEEANRNLATVEEALRKEESTLTLAKSEYEAALQRDALIDGWKATLKAADGLEAVTPDEIETATAAVTKAREGIEQGAFVRQAKANVERREEHKGKQVEHEKAAERYREMAGGIDGVLSGIVATLGTDLRIEKGRLVCATDRGEATLFAELSHGEKWRKVIDLVVDIVGARGVIVCPQEAYEGIDPPTRIEIADYARSKGVVVLTAEATDDEELTSEIL
jgi:hypothetical protein